MTDRIDALVAELASVSDAELAGEVRSPQAVALLAGILDSPAPTRARRPGRRPLMVAFAALVLAAALAIPAFGVGPEIVSFLTGARDPDAPVATGSDIVVASGVAGAPWKLIATRSDKGLCLGLLYRVDGDTHGPSCGYLDIRGDLPADVRGDAASKCLGPPSSLAPGGTLVSCGSLPQHWIGAAGNTSGNGLDHIFSIGVVAEEVARVDLVLNEGRVLRAHIVGRPGGLPLNVFWAAWACPLQPAPGTYEPCAAETDFGSDVKVAVARDRNGRILEKRVPAWNGNPTGDPDGPRPPAPLSP
jgi:hypothetical protein